MAALRGVATRFGAGVTRGGKDVCNVPSRRIGIVVQVEYFACGSMRRLTVTTNVAR